MISLRQVRLGGSPTPSMTVQPGQLWPSKTIEPLSTIERLRAGKQFASDGKVMEGFSARAGGRRMKREKLLQMKEEHRRVW